MYGIINRFFLKYVGFRLPPNTKNGSIAEGLIYLVHSKDESIAGVRLAYRICCCTQKKIEELWDTERLARLQEELNLHAKAQYQSLPMNKEDLMRLLKRGLPRPSEYLNSELIEIAPYIIEYSEKYDARIEF